MTQARPVPPPQPAWHAIPVAGVRDATGSGQVGLTRQAAAERLATDGPNALPEPRGRGPLRRFLAQFDNMLIHVLLAAAAITALLQEWPDMAVILGVVLINALIGFIQEGKAEQAMDAIRKMLAPNAAVIRDGVRRTVPAADLVRGDIVLLEAGDRVPADLRISTSHGLRVAEAILTGESVPVAKAPDPVAEGAALGDRTSMAFSGTLVSAGQGQGIVVATGPSSEIGRISRLIAGVEQNTTPLLRQMDSFGRRLTLAILAVGVLLVLHGLVVAGSDFADVFMAVVGLSVAAIPEGLPAVLTITLAIGVRAMARRSAIVRKLPAIETMGAVSAICTDKTGTLTRNEMVVTSIATPDRVVGVAGAGYGPDGTVDPGLPPAVMARIARVALFCNDAALGEEDGQWIVHGDPMEGALKALGHRIAGLSAPAHQRLSVLPFSAETRCMATLDTCEGADPSLHVKGAPEVLFELCRLEYDGNDRTVPLRRDKWQARADELAAGGSRVLALAIRPDDRTPRPLVLDDLGDGLVLLALVGLVDPPRPEAILAVEECRSAGIAVKMITGDHALTAAAIGRSVGLERPDRVLTGAMIDGLDNAALQRAVRETTVFARTTPEHKLRLVEALQATGSIVAMTGDGVNDTPALKRADVGIAMGRKGSDAAREAAELVLTDDNFASIVAAVREGRTVYDNLVKVIAWTLPTNVGEAMTIIVALLLGMTLPVTPVQILWINLVTATTLGVALAFEPTEPGTMKRPPRAPDAPLLSVLLLWRVAFVSAIFLGAVFGMFAYALEQGHDIAVARTLAVNMLVVLEIFNLFAVRRIHGSSFTWRAVLGTPVIWLAIAVLVIAQSAITWLPPMHRLFDTAAVPFTEGMLVIAIGAASLVVMELEKAARLWLARRYRASRRQELPGPAGSAG
ncbi:MAG: HAD-IC family P-type ATPase [Pseudomonadota bacterium]|nr:HAD-IC family P-type ATPase [Pseudomonadota bacterium]